MARHDLARALWKFRWLSLPGRTAMADAGLLKSCAGLFSTSYARWGDGGPRPGEPVRIGPDHLRRLLDSEEARILCAFEGGILAGYAVILRFRGTGGQRVAWISQLVVGPTYRRSRVATTLLFSAWQFSDYDVWGIVTANPYAVRALETATRRPCRARTIVANGGPVLGDLRRFLPYLPEDFDRVPDRLLPSVDSRFHIDLSEMERMREGAARADRPWNLGMIAEGHEWFAATFSSQVPSVAKGEYLKELLEGVDAFWIRAYEGMTLDSDHGWHRHGRSEAEWILSRVGTRRPSSALDAGCGDGRHAVALAQQGLTVTGVDISARLLERAERRLRDAGVHADLREADLRDPAAMPDGRFDLVLCLYDVIGSSASPADDRLVLANLRARIADDGLLVLSVMNSASTLPFLPPEQRPESEADFVAALEKLPPSREMEQSGSVFDPRYILYFSEVFYRKEQFDVAKDLPPSELVIRDRRFSPAEISTLVEAAGFEVVEVLGVRAGRWDHALDPQSEQAREILVVAQPRR